MYLSLGWSSPGRHATSPAPPTSLSTPSAQRRWLSAPVCRVVPQGGHIPRYSRDTTPPPPTVPSTPASPSLDQQRRGLTLLGVSTTIIYNHARIGEIPAGTACGGPREDDYWPVKLGERRSRKESRASWTSC